MTIYTILLAFYGLGYLSSRHVEDKEKKAKLCFMLLFPMFFLTAFRASYVGNDTKVYIYGYNAIANATSLLYQIRNSRYEPGYVTLTYLFTHLKLSYQVFQVVVSAFIYYSLYVFLRKYSKNVWLSVYIFFTLRDIFSSMNVVRMYIGIAIILYAIPFLQERKFFQFAALTGLASMFHTTALAFLVLYPLSALVIRRKTIIRIFAGAFGILLMGKTFFTWLTRLINRYQGYLSSTYFNIDNNIAIYFSLAIDVSLFALMYLTQKESLESGCSYWQRRYQEEPIPIEHIELWTALIVVALDVIGLGNTIMGRVSGYFSVFFMIGVPSGLQALKRRSNRLIMNLVLVFFFALQFYAVMILRPNWNGVTPYQVFFKF